MSPSPGRWFTQVLARYGSIVMLVVLLLGMSLATPEFSKLSNLLNVARQVSIVAIIATGMTFVIITAGIDLSVGSVLALAGVISMTFLRDGLPITGALPILLAIPLSAVVASFIGAGCGAFNGFFVTRFRMAPFVATLAMMTIARGLAYVYTDGAPVSPLPPAVGEFGASEVNLLLLRIPTLVLIALVVVAVGHVLLSRTSFGRRVYAIGGNEEAARLSGINVRRAKLEVYSLCGLLAGLSGMLLATRLASGDPKSGMGFELNAIAAVVLGGTSLMGGRGTVVGTLLGALVIGVLDNGLILLDVSAFYQMVVKGFVILAAVLLDTLTRTDR